MDTVSHREMRNNSGEILRRVEAGESIQVTNHGRIAAIISPAPADALTELEQSGQLRRARRGVQTLATIRRRRSHVSTAQIRDDSRGSW